MNRFELALIIIPIVLLIAYRVWKSKKIESFFLDLFGKSNNSPDSLINERKDAAKTAKQVERKILDKKKSLAKDLNTLS